MKSLVYNLKKLKLAGIKEKRFCGAKKEWGLSRVISLKDFCEASNGFLKDDVCSFGVEVIFSAPIETTVATFTTTRELRSYNFTWKIPKFSKLKTPREYSPAFYLNRRSW